MDKRDLQQLLNQPYEQENWKRIVQFVFPNVSLLATPKEFPINNDKIVRFSQIGSVRLNDGKNLALFELLLADNVNLQRNRVELNNEISKYIDQEQIHGVLSVFEQGGDDYRFTFSAKSTEFDEEESDFVSVKTDTKRFTYVLGKNESCKTPAKRFYELSENKENATIQAIQKAFSVEKLSKEFFDKYKKEFEIFWNYIANDDELKKLFLEQDKDKQIRDFTKKLLGRIVFLHFLQKKGWMGCDSSKEGWEDGDKQFMQNLFLNFEDKEHFHSKCLSQLFFDTLNNGKRENAVFTCEGLNGELNGSKIPYLNGGLFDTDAEISKKIDFPVEYFESLFDFFSHYNFTIDENDPNDHEVGIDPEMLGHIFENLLEDNKDKGAFYTPKIVVQFMCQESIIEYLTNKLDAQPDSEKRYAIENLIRKQLAQEVNDLDIVESIAQALYDVKICDPAIGSGAFPMGILNEIYQIIEMLYWLQPDAVADIWKIDAQNWQPHLVKKNIIQHSIYGVDLESGAVDIARLRFWLALVVDELEPMPLPNLDYKIMQGNSLLESFEGIDLSEIANAKAYETILDEKAQYNLFTGSVKTSTKVSSLKYEDIKSLMDDYFEVSDPKVKGEIHKRIDDQVLNHIHYTITSYKNKLLAQKKSFQNNIRAKVDRKIQSKISKIDEKLAELDKKEIKLTRLSNTDERPFFLWHLFFQEVFESGGFDIVIANPPYVGEKGNKEVFRATKEGFLGEYYKAKMDLFYFFFHLSLNFSKEGGIICFITTNYFLTADGALKLRNDFKDRSTPILFFNFNEFKIFDSALGQHNIITILRKGNFHFPAKIANVRASGFYNYSKLKRILQTTDSDTDYLSKDEVFESEQAYIRINSTSGDQKSLIIDKIKNGSELLPYYAEINSGCDITLSKISPSHIKDFSDLSLSKGEGVFVISKMEQNLISLNESEKRLLKPFIKNSNINKYSHSISDDKLLYIDWNEIETSIPNIISHLEKYKAIMLDQIERYDEPSWPWYAIHRPRDQKIFENTSKIIVPYRSKENSFAYSDKPVYSSRDVFYITLKEQFEKDLIYVLLGILNSRLIYFWLYNQGKRKGETLELYSTPLSQIPIKLNKDTDQLISFVKEQIGFSKKNGHLSTDLQLRIDAIVYEIYGLEENEIEFINDFNRHSNI